MEPLPQPGDDELGQFHEEGFWKAINAVPLREDSSIYSSSEDDDDMSVTEWREISQRLDSDFDSEFESESEEELPPVAALPKASPKVLTSVTQSRPKRISTKKPKRSSKPKEKKAEPKPVVKKPLPKTIECTFPKCARRFVTRRGLHQHLKHHADTKRVFMCIVCALRFLRMKDLHSHTRDVNAHR